MKKYQSTDIRRQRQYQVMIDMANDKSSNLYLPNGSQNQGASNRTAFWRGYNGTFENHPNLAYSRTSIAYPSYRAGIDFRNEVKAND